MKPEDMIWRMLERFEESKGMLEEHLADLHPKRDSQLIDALHECERLILAQIAILRRAERRCAM